MARKSSLAEATGAIFRFLDGRPQKVFTTADLRKLLEAHREEWRLRPSVQFGAFLAGLVKAEHIRELEFLPGETGRPMRRYALSSSSNFGAGLSLAGPGAYLSHASAVYLHGLTDQIPKVVYVNKEQSPKPRPTAPLTQAAIDRAFANQPRQSRLIYACEDSRYVMLSGKNTGRLEVSPMQLASGEVVAVTRLERTLIDIAVRPVYAGGVPAVLAAFRGAADRLSVPTLVATLKGLDYVYPYHQVLGFYLQRAGFTPDRLKRLADLGLKHDFYLAHRIVDRLHDPDWRVWYPAGM